MAASTLLLDLDGTLWDSHEWYGAALCAGSGLAREDAVARLRAGHNVVRLAREAGISDARFGRLCYEAVSSLSLYPGVPEALRTLGGRGTLMGVVTNLPRRLVEPVIGDLGIAQHFATRIYNAKKPSGGGILRALGELGREAGVGAFYVGDMETDALAAQRAGVRFAWASYGYCDERPPQATAVLEEFADILTL